MAAFCFLVAPLPFPVKKRLFTMLSTSTIIAKIAYGLKISFMYVVPISPSTWLIPIFTLVLWEFYSLTPFNVCCVLRRRQTWPRMEKARCQIWGQNRVCMRESSSEQNNLRFTAYTCLPLASARNAMFTSLDSVSSFRSFSHALSTSFSNLSTLKKNTRSSNSKYVIHVLLAE